MGCSKARALNITCGEPPDVFATIVPKCILELERLYEKHYWYAELPRCMRQLITCITMMLDPKIGLPLLLLNYLAPDFADIKQLTAHDEERSFVKQRRAQWRANEPREKDQTKPHKILISTHNHAQIYYVDREQYWRHTFFLKSTPEKIARLSREEYAESKEE